MLQLNLQSNILLFKRQANELNGYLQYTLSPLPCFQVKSTDNYNHSNLVTTVLSYLQGRVARRDPGNQVVITAFFWLL